MRATAVKTPLRLAGAASLALLAGCTDPLDFDLRGNLGGFSTADAAQTATADRPEPDARGVISYPNYQVAVARQGDTVSDVAARVGLGASEVARFNGMTPDINLRAGEIIALPRRVAEPSAATGAVDIASVAGAAIDAAPDTTPVETTALEPAAPEAPTRTPTAEPVRHKVQRGETAYTIARLYQVPVRALAEWNGLGSDFAIREGQFLLIPVSADGTPTERADPGPTETAAAVAAPGAGSPTPTPPSATGPLPDEEVAPRAQPDEETAASADVGEPTRSTDAAMAFPVTGRIIRTYSKGRNDGIDIAADPGTPVTAAADGTVAAITESADQVPIIVVRHPDNLLTVYANVTGIAVAKDDRVRRGQKLAELRDGDNAYVHFEVRDGFDSVDPMPYLE